MTQTSSQDVSSIHEEQLWTLFYHLTGCRPLGSVASTCWLFDVAFFKNDANQGETVKLENMSKSGGHTSPMRGVLSVLWLSIEYIDPLYSVYRRLRPPGDQQTFPKHANYSYFHLLRLKKNSHKNTKNTTFLFVLVMYCFLRCHTCVSICSKHIPSTLDVNRSVSTHI